MTAVITEPGIYPDLDADQYHADPTPHGSLSSTWARKLMEPAGPAKFRHQQDNPQPVKKVFEFGHAAHSIVLGDGPQIAQIPDELLAANGAASTKAAKEFMDEARDNGQIPLKAAEYRQVHDMAAAIAAHDEASKLLASKNLQPEVSAFRVDPVTGVWLRARFDAVSPAGIIDYKTTVDADPHLFARKTAHELGYHQQDAWYRDTAAALGITEKPLKFILQQKTAPYLVSVVELDQTYVDIGRARNRAAIDLYHRCIETNTWPGYEGVELVGPPQWLIDRADAELSTEIASELAAYAATLRKDTAA